MHTLLQIQDVASKTSGAILQLKELAVIYVPKIIGALVIYIAGSWLINKLSNGLQQTMLKKHYDPSLQTFLFSMVKISFTILLLISILGLLGMDISVFSALLVGLGIAVGSALNGSLGNFAGGVMLLIFKPFKVGEKIEAQGQTGTVTELGIFNTVLLATDHRTIILPNGPLSTNSIINYSAHGDLRIEALMAIAADQDIDKARGIAMEAMLAHPAVLKTPLPEIDVFKVGDGMTTLTIRPYALQKDYWTVYFGAQESVKKAWDAAGIQAPVPTVINLNRQAD